MDKFIEDALKKAHDANLLTDESAKHVGELFDQAKIPTMEAWRKTVPESIVVLFCSIYNPMPPEIFNAFVSLWEAFFVAGYWARNHEVLEEGLKGGND